MQRTTLLAACLLILPALHVGAAAVSAQAPSEGRPAGAPDDTLAVTLAEARHRALSGSPEYLGQRQMIDIAQGQRTQAQQLAFNPELELEAPGAVSAGAVRGFDAFLAQELELGGQRGLRIRAADAGLERARAEVGDAARRTLAEVSHAFVVALAGQQRLRVVTELLDLSRRLLEATRIQAREGEISDMESNLAEIEAGRAHARMLAEEREARSARIELLRRMGLPPEQEIRLTPGPTDPDEPATLDADTLVALALARRPDLVARSQAGDQYAVLERLARREAIPNPRVGLFVGREDAVPERPGAGESDPGPASIRVGLGVSLPVPLFQRNGGTAAEYRARTGQARYETQAAELAVRAEVADALAAYRSAAEEVEVFERDVLVPARANQQLLETAFEAGKLALPTLLLLRNQLLDAELGYWDAWLALQRARIDLQSATATLGTQTTPDSIGATR